MTLRSIVLAFVVLSLDAMHVAVAQGAPPPAVRCFRPSPLPRCASFWIYEVEYGHPLVTTGRTVRYTFPPTLGDSSLHANDVDQFLVWHLGMMRNTDSTSAVGGSFDIGFSGIGVRAGVSARRRQWLQDGLAVEGSGGLALMNVRGPTDASQHLLRVGLTGGVAVSHRDRIALTLRGDLAPSSKTAAALYGGGELRSTTGLVGTGVGAVLFGLFIAVLFREDS